MRTSQLGALQAVGRRLGWGILDQGVSSVTNFGTGILIARLSHPVDFGAFSLAFSTYLIGLSVSRALGSQPLAVRHSSASQPSFREAAMAANGVILAVGLAGSCVAMAVAIVGGDSVFSAFGALAIVFPGLLLQDGCRLALFAASRGSAAFANDSVWALTMLPALLLANVLSHGDVFALIAAWGLSATLAAAFGVAQVKATPDLSATMRWLRSNRDIAPHYLIGDVANAASGQIAMFAVGGVVGLAAAGSLRAAQLLMGPLNVMTQGIGNAAIPEAARMLQESRQRLAHAAVRLSLLTGVVGAAWAAAMALLPEPLGTSLLGANWAGAHPLLTAVGFQWTALSVQVGFSVGLRAIGVGRPTLAVSLAGAVMTVVGGAIGLLIAGVSGAAFGLAAAACVTAAMWALRFNAEIASR